MNLQSLEDYNKQKLNQYPKYPLLNGIACPKCGKEMYDRDNLILTSNPPKKRVICLECGHNDYAFH